MAKQVNGKTAAQDWIGVPEAAKRMGCSDVWVLRLIRSGQLEAFRLSAKAWAVSAAAVERNVQEYLKRDPAVAGRKRSRM
jgi:excisionase family DNA binding protein